MSSIAPPVLECRNVDFAYSRSLVLRGVSLHIGRGEFFGLVGPNGAGKSTLLHLLTGSYFPLKGEILVQGRPTTHLSRTELAQKIAFVPQRTQPAFSFTVREMVLMGRHPYAGFALFETETDLQVAESVMREVGIGHLAEKSFDALSGGEQQLVILARAFAQETSILVLDEPTSFLDLRHQWEILRLLEDRVKRGDTVIATFHDLNVAARWCQHVAILCNGRLIAQGVPKRVLTADRLREVYGVEIVVSELSNGCLRVELP